MGSWGAGVTDEGACAWGMVTLGILKRTVLVGRLGVGCEVGAVGRTGGTWWSALRAGLGGSGLEVAAGFCPPSVDI